MSTTSIVCRGLQSCLEPHLLEPRVLMHQLHLVPSKQGLSFPWPHKQTDPENPTNFPIDITFESSRNGDESLSCWNIMQSMKNPSSNLRKSMEEAEKGYVHPLAKRSSYCLSSKSLEMCTESLGSETGSVIDSSMDQSSLEAHEKQTKRREEMKKVRQRSSFPPPLTSISGSEGVHVKTHREGGRLVIKAFCFSSSSTNFRTERKKGRLRLSLLKPESGNEEEEDEDCDVDGDDLKRVFKVENVKNDGGKVGCGGGEWATSRCNGDRRKRLPSLQYCVAIS